MKNIRKKQQQQQRDDYKKHDTQKNSKRDGERERQRGWEREGGKVKKNANMEWYRYENEELVYTTNAKLKME